VSRLTRVIDNIASENISYQTGWLEIGDRKCQPMLKLGSGVTLEFDEDILDAGIPLADRKLSAIRFFPNSPSYFSPDNFGA
jgi:hypothetical protein